MNNYSYKAAAFFVLYKANISMTGKEEMKQCFLRRRGKQTDIPSHQQHSMMYRSLINISKTHTFWYKSTSGLSLLRNTAGNTNTVFRCFGQNTSLEHKGVKDQGKK